MVCQTHDQKGAILLLILFYAGIFAILIQNMTSSVWLNQKIVEDFKKQTGIIKRTEREHAKQQERATTHQHIQFVPDSLNYFEHHGTHYYTIITRKKNSNQAIFQSFYAARKQEFVRESSKNKMILCPTK